MCTTKMAMQKSRLVFLLYGVSKVISGSIFTRLVVPGTTGKSVKTGRVKSTIFLFIVIFLILLEPIA